MHGHVSGGEFAAWAAIAAVLAAALGLGLAILGGRLAARRAAASSPERWRRQ